ncbi:MAG: thymidine phosphorylase [Bacteroidia bacterium]|nr:MAG: thymidine phosphorylase [Bacteroidia bacterium]
MRFLLEGYLRGTLPDYQMSAFLMACYFRGMSDEETETFTRLMLHSGQIVDLSDVPGIKVDKHSTGGVGDKVSLILAPIVASHGVPVPMISGRGLGHTGGTLDKLESIPGFRTSLSVAEYKRILRETGAVLMGQTAEIAPADRKLYALRDVTATVECIPLIAGSILSKKIAEGIDALVLDVKTGRGAFMSSYEDSVNLAKTLVDLGTRFGKNTRGFVTDMEQPLGVAVGNWLEVVEAVECLRGARGDGDASADLMEVTHTLAGAMLEAGGKAGSLDEGIRLSRQAVADGSAYRKFLHIVETQGGNTRAIENLELSPTPRHALSIKSPVDGFVAGIDALEVGLVSIQLGAGRQKLDDVLDLKAGIVLRVKVGTQVQAGDLLAELFTDRDDVVASARQRLQNAFLIRKEPPVRRPLLHCYVDQEGIHPRWQ